MKDIDRGGDYSSQQIKDKYDIPLPSKSGNIHLEAIELVMVYPPFGNKLPTISLLSHPT
jgi:hypothetical protein